LVQVRSFTWLVLAACGSTTTADPAPPPKPDAGVAAKPPKQPTAKLPKHTEYATLDAAIAAVVPADARVIGFGELHARVDRASVPSALSAFTRSLPSFGDKVSDLVVETWIADPKCGQKAATTTKKIETEVRRPVETRNEVGLLAEAAKAAKIQPHAMTLTCKDYDTLAPKNGPADPVAMLTLTTKELTRVATSAVVHRNKTNDPRRFVAIYGGALHNDRFPDPGVAEWSIAAALDSLTINHFIEVDLIVPEFAEPDPASQKAPWFPLVADAAKFRVWKRGERSFVIVLPRSPTTK
jgi:hypothetical protein